ncbi:MAG: VOC family protein [Gammaproteobacteria bacterium]
MTVPFKPEGYTSVAPYLVVNGAVQTIEFLERVFGAERLRFVAAPNGPVMHAEVRIDDTVVMLADASGEAEATHSHVHVYVRNVDATFAKAIEAGAKSIREPVKGHDSDKRGGFQDAGGTTWWVGTQVEAG